MRRLVIALIALSSVIAHAETLRIGLEGTYPPFSYIDERGQLVGFDVDLGKALAAHLGRGAEFVQTRWDGMFAALDSGRFDVVINSVTITEERKKKYAFSDAYYFSGLQLIGKPGSPVTGPEDLAGKRVGVGLGTIHEKWLREHNIPADIRTYEDDASRNQDLLVGRIDAVLNDRLAVAHMLQEYQGRLVTIGAPFDRQEKAAVMRRDQAALAREVNGALAAMRSDGSLPAISEKWFGLDVTR